MRFYLDQKATIDVKWSDTTNHVWSCRWIPCRWSDWTRCYRTQCSAQRTRTCQTKPETATSIATRSSADAEMGRHASRYRRRDYCLWSAKLHIFFIPQLSSSVEFGITWYYNPGRLRHAGSQDSDLSCRLPISNFCCTVTSQFTNVTDRQTHGRTDG